jgi:hypothetical protein
LRLIAPTALMTVAVCLSGCAQFERAFYFDRPADQHAAQNSGMTPAQKREKPPKRPGAEFGRQVAVFDGHELWVDYLCDDDSRLMVRYLGHWADAVTPDGVFHRLTRKGDEVLYQAAGGYDLRGSGLKVRWTTPAGALRCRGGV